MLARVQRILRIARVHAHTSTWFKLSLISAAELARSSWARPIESYAVVPDIYKSFFDPFLASGKAFPYTVLTPSPERFIHRDSEKLICNLEDEIWVLERNGNTFEAHCYPLEGLSYVEFRTALLASSFKISGLTDAGDYVSLSLKFNSVTDYLFTPILNKARRVELCRTKAKENLNSEQFDRLVKVNYKFMNYARHSLMGGEKVLHSILQPEIREGVFSAMGRTYFRTISPTHMLILTDRELILIREEATRRREDRYGGIWDYIPLDKIESLSLIERNGDLWVFSIHLPGNACFELLYQGSVIGEVKPLLDQIK